MSDTELKPCPFCGGGETKIEPKGQIWMGMKDCEPKYFTLRHICKGLLPDKFVTNDIATRAKTEAQCIEAWNTRAAPTVKPLVWEEYGYFKSVEGSVQGTQKAIYTIIDSQTGRAVLYDQNRRKIKTFKNVKSAKSFAQSRHNKETIDRLE